uniref:PDZ GRASP-type domain-containing protein n=1 Tax=Hyaloperonospora arabidopsidis (strain Emoy2) TaxID=559515 RepID=M4C4E4_HYAAE
MELLAQSEDRPMRLQVYNAKTQATRELKLTPSRKWPGKGLIGVTIRFDSYEGVEDQLVHVLNVVDSSPAERAGLRAGSDYLLGTPDRVFTDAEDLHDEIVDALDGSFQCYVYNTLDDQVRIVTIVPTESWGGDGVLGAEVGHGYLHRLPSACRNTIGSSVGFVNLPKGAKAATDAFLKPHQYRNECQDNSEADEEKRPQDSEPIVTARGNRQACSPIRGVNRNTAAEQSLPEGDGKESVSAFVTDAKTVPLAGSRYTVRSDLQFPISTVAVLADS